MKQQKSYTVEDATRLLEKYCAYQERCHKDVEQKLYDLKLIPEAKEQIIIHLLQHNFLNEERFAKAFARGKFNQNKWGKIKITSELKFKNISSYNIKTALKEINEADYVKTLQQIAEKKIVLIKETNTFKKRAKLYTYLSSKGFETSLINNCLNQIFQC
ncbi:regulatory protein RecX [Lutibacter sp. TH_r2]|uniref:regulatory protein RecX n=1 Tax=Lutibacter sp. TH_r2 TaxID=3082083 RepID=UPI0029543C2B|nr:regulatory protein RecX [Lutibacter sp. TH_r2]MDV7186193.1 regulatory protein RecX [Lutibacter sp. TH_r2]